MYRSARGGGVGGRGGEEAKNCAGMAKRLFRDLMSGQSHMSTKWAWTRLYDMPETVEETVSQLTNVEKKMASLHKER